MAYRQQNTITAADLNAFLASARDVYGVGTGTFGYGQTTHAQSNVTAGVTTIAASHWRNLRNMISVCGSHQGSNVSDLPPLSVLDAGDTITAHEKASPSLNAYDFSTPITNIVANRLDPHASSMTLSSGVHDNSRGSTWSTTIVGTYQANFVSEDAARYFFNSGGEIRIRLSHPSGSSSQDDAWRAAFAAIGTMRMKWGGIGSFSITGTATSGITLSGAQGYYNLGTSHTISYENANLGGGSYSNCGLKVEARILNRQSIRGANGSGIEFKITLTDGYSGGGDSVAAGTTIEFDVYRATTHLTGIAAPTFSTVSGF